jgi:hypothetical protein
MNEQKIQTVIRNTQRRWFEDGLWEIAFGCANLLLGLYFLFIVAFDLETRWGSWLALAQVLVVLGVFGGLRFGVSFLKERLTFPRTGFVTYRRPEQAERRRRAFLRGFLAGGVGAGVAVIVGLTSSPNLAAGLTALILAGVCFYMGVRFGLTRYAIVAFITLLLGVALTQFQFGDEGSLAVLFCGFGLTLSVAGGLTLASFLHRTHPVKEQDV